MVYLFDGGDAIAAERNEQKYKARSTSGRRQREHRVPVGGAAALGGLGVEVED